MGSLPMIVCVMVGMAVFASTVQANYHVSDLVTGGDKETYYACPSNYYNCDCYLTGKRRGSLSQTPGSFFSITNLCGYKQLNHYLNSDGTYSVFVAGGDGKVVATCYSADIRKATLHCAHGLHDPITRIVYDHLICYGHPCEP